MANASYTDNYGNVMYILVNAAPPAIAPNLRSPTQTPAGVQWTLFACFRLSLRHGNNQSS
jgi:hypothetical protein